MKTAHIFPAFVPEYLGIEQEVLQYYDINLQKYLEKATIITQFDLTKFDIIKNNFHDKPLESQFIAYVFSCCISDLLHRLHKKPDFVLSYSMGIYAAMYHCGSINFSTGLQLITEAYNSIERNLPSKKSGMAAIGGLSYDDVLHLIKVSENEATIINQNSEFSFLLSGNYSKLEQLIEQAKAEGAMQARLLPVFHPYHTASLKNAAVEFADILQKMAITNSQYPYVSSLDQRILLDKNQIINELKCNLYLSFDWWKTIKLVVQHNCDTLIECGAGESLYKIGKFIEGDFRIFNLKKIKQYLNS
ncbi:MAG: hypothetical protein WCQ95_04400 [Bacteroidota bacterium]